MRILQQIEGSVLWLLEENPITQAQLRAFAQNHGIAMGRLIFTAGMSKSEHLERLQCADLFLDTRFYNAHTTGSDALWAGVPILTLIGETFAARVGLVCSLLWDYLN
jgi:protein O-GlcNAc transferase